MRKYIQIDILKGMAITSIVLLHSIDENTLEKIWSIFHIGQAVPVFLILMGLTLGVSSAGKEISFKALYSRTYFYLKFERFVLSFLPVLFISTIIHVWCYTTKDVALDISPQILIGRLPLPMPGDYFVTFIFFYIFLSPLLLIFYKKYPCLSVACSFLICLLFETIAPMINFFTHYPYKYLYATCIFRYIFAIYIGLWLSTDFRINAKRNLWIWCGSIVSIVFLFLMQVCNYDFPFFIDQLKVLRFHLSMYAAIIVIIGMSFFQYLSAPFSLFAVLGKSSYHILLAQMVYFGVVARLYRFPVFYELLICSSLGVLFYLTHLHFRKYYYQKLIDNN